ncbi:MAG TPA: molybdopterin-dependent oxidoreductase [Candidatus Binataceae bacterium]|nr:molybdopterin-dependent oxidoreductase [Candidatus Binataceae bacterium]
MADGFSRRTFLKLAATAGAGAALPGCQPAARKLIPYVVPDENVIPGVAQFYTTTCAECPAGCGLIARVREGRVIKLEGNPADPLSQGAICARGQAALQGLYNPDRIARPQLRGDGAALANISWEQASKLLNEKLAAAARAGKDRVAFLGAPGGPTFEKIVRAWLGAHGSTRAIFYEALATEPARAAAQQLFGRRDLPVYRLDQAEVLISFGADFLETWQSPVELTRQYAEFRTPKPRRGALTIGRSFYVGPRLGLTAAKCDEWIAAAPDAQAQIAWSVLHVMIAERWISQNSHVDLAALTAMVAGFDPASVSARTGVPANAIRRMGEAFGKADGAVALAPTHDESATLAAYVLNAVTGNAGRTMVFLDGAPPESVSRAGEVEAALGAMHDGKVDVLFIAGGNPVFSMSAGIDAAGAFQRVPFVVWCGGVPDETANMANLLLPAHHPLEAWRDTAPRAGVNGLGQPVMQPVFPSRAVGDILLESARANALAGAAIPWKTVAEAVKAEWFGLASRAGGIGAEDFWTKARQEGGLFQDAKPSEVKLNSAVLKAPPAPPASAELTLSAYPHIFLYDGRGADKPWLQEIPEPIAQIVWDTWAEIHPDTARSLGVAADELIELRTDHGSIEAPALISERVRPGVIAIPLGQGHRSYGRYAIDRGANPWALLAPGALSIAVAAKPTGNSRALVSPLGNSDLMGRSIVEAMSIEELARGGAAPAEALAPEPYEMYPPFPHPEHKWGMTIDTNACTGCSACIAACYAENNVPVSGREGVAQGRIRSWIRIERFFPEKQQEGRAPLAYLTPMMCQQCNHAPCEAVCPVFASHHTDEGLNAQIYNRCIGTRYCQNNCPYKVRRFNWFEPEWPAPLDLQLNPDVTVRGMGVMEKCTFCIQRIQHAEIVARTESRPVRDGEIVPACAQACPARAITFGDMNDASSAVMRRRAANPSRGFRALEDLNTQPAIVYLRELYREKEGT